MTGSENTRREERRLQALERYGVLGNERDPEFDELTRLAARLCGTTAAAVNFIGSDQQWTKASHGIEIDSIARELSFCSHTILADGPLVIPDATQDPRFQDNPLVTGPPHIRFYAGIPLTTPEGDRIGTLCVTDSTPRTLDDEKIDALRAIARQVIAQLELRRKVLELSEATTSRERAEEALRQRDTGRATQIGKPAAEKAGAASGAAVWLAFVLSLSITLAATWLSISNVGREWNERFAEQIEDFVSVLVDRLSAYEELERAGAAFVSSSEKVTRSEWNHFVNTVAIERRYPGLQMTGLVEHVRSEGLQSFIAEATEDSPGFSLHPKGDRDEYYIVRFVNPPGPNSQVEGFDLSTESLRRFAATVAMEKGLPRATDKLTLIQDAEGRPAFLLFYPVYRKDMPTETIDERRAALIGWIYLGIRVEDLISQLPAISMHGLAIDMHSATDGDGLLYSSDWAGFSSLRPRVSSKCTARGGASIFAPSRSSSAVRAGASPPASSSVDFF